jgi:hypothetical protein
MGAWAVFIDAGRSGGTRTHGPRFWRPMLYQLSYTPAGRVPLSGAMDLGKRLTGPVACYCMGGAEHSAQRSWSLNMPKKQRTVTVERIYGSSRRVEANAWQKWLEEAAKLIERFDCDETDDPFAYNETASVSLLASAAARIDALALAEFSVTKRGRLDGRRRSNGRADFWMRMPKGRAWSFEFKQITYETITIDNLHMQMNEANTCASKLISYGPDYRVAGMIVPLYYVDQAERGRSRERLYAFKSECDFVWHLHAPDDGPETFFFFNMMD